MSPGSTAAPRPRVPEATIARLPLYLRALHELADDGRGTVRSEALATAAGVGSATLRKDLSHLGSYGTRGVGYDVEHLVEQVSRELGVSRQCSVVLVGIGNLGRALAGYAGFAARGLAVAALLDSDPAKVGQQVDGLVVRHLDELPVVVAGADVTIGVIATPSEAAQQVCDLLVAAGVTSVLSFAPTALVVPDDVDLRRVDLSVELQILSFHEHRKAALAAPAQESA